MLDFVARNTLPYFSEVSGRWPLAAGPLTSGTYLALGQQSSERSGIHDEP